MINNLLKYFYNSIKVLGYISLTIITLVVILFIYYYLNHFETSPSIPVVINTWAFTDSTNKSNNFFEFLQSFLNSLSGLDCL